MLAAARPKPKAANPPESTQSVVADIRTVDEWSWRRAIVFMVVTALAAWSGLLVLGYGLWLIVGPVR